MTCQGSRSQRPNDHSLEATMGGSCHDLERPTGRGSSPLLVISQVTLQESLNLSECPFPYLQNGSHLPPSLLRRI